MSRLLTTDPDKRPSAGEILLSLTNERAASQSRDLASANQRPVTGDNKQVSARSMLQNVFQSKDEQDDSGNDDYSDSDEDYDNNQTLVKPHQTVQHHSKILPQKSRSDSSRVKSPDQTPAARHQPPSSPPFLMISSPGPAADYRSQMFGVYRLSEEMREGRSVYIQEHDNTMYGGSPSHSQI